MGMEDSKTCKPSLVLRRMSARKRGTKRQIPFNWVEIDTAIDKGLRNIFATRLQRIDANGDRSLGLIGLSTSFS